MTALDTNDGAHPGSGSAGQPLDLGLPERLRNLVRAMPPQNDARALLDQVVTTAVTHIPGAAFAGLTLAVGSELSTEAASDDIVKALDRAQYDSGQGPSIRRTRTEETIRSDDLAGERRWPEFAACAVSLGLRSMLSFQLFVQRHNVGVMNLYATRTAAFDDDDELLGAVLASYAAIALGAMRKQANLEIALDSRDVIGQAKGILMDRFKIGADEAFALIVDASQHAHRTVRELARDVAESGEFPPPT